MLESRFARRGRNVLELGIKTLLAYLLGIGHRQPAARPAARRRHPHAGQRQRRRHQCAAHPGRGVRARRHRHRRGQGAACRRLCCPASPPGSASIRASTASGWPRVRGRRGVRARLPGVVRIARWQGRGDADRRGRGAGAGGARCRCCWCGLLTVLLTGFVGLGTMLGTATLPLYFAFATPRSLPLVVFGLLMAAFVVFTHRSNLQRMRAGIENRARRLWLLRPR